ncbi:hypothetical protein B2G69_07175 [Methylorubrum zatmanii]|nr:hypothetical protein [Methylorubrum zatmanii]ARO53953.1 hypothetical protein B2G69_07175 [Methylorubrum zatmanii]
MSSVAASIIAKCNGHAVVAEICGVHVTRVYRWTYPVEKGGSGGVIPTRHQALLLKGARARGIDLRPEDFFDPACSGVATAADRPRSAA